MGFENFIAKLSVYTAEKKEIKKDNFSIQIEQKKRSNEHVIVFLNIN